MGDPKVENTTPDSTGQFVAHLPELLRTIGANILPMGEKTLEAQQKIAPGQSQLAIDLLKQYGPQYAEANAAIDKSTAKSNAETTADVLGTTGRAVAEKGLDVAKIFDPEFYGMRGALSDKTMALINSLSGDGSLSGGEQEQITRGLNRTNVLNGTANSGSPTAAISNAMTFGDALMKKKANTASILASVAPSLSAVRSGFNPFAEASGRSSYGTSTQYNPNAYANANVGGDTNAFANNFLNTTNAAAMQASQLNANRRDALDRTNETMSSLPT